MHLLIGEKGGHKICDRLLPLLLRERDKMGKSLFRASNAANANLANGLQN